MHTGPTAGESPCRACTRPSGEGERLQDSLCLLCLITDVPYTVPVCGGERRDGDAPPEDRDKAQKKWPLTTKWAGEEARTEEGEGASAHSRTCQQLRVTLS